MTCSIGIRRILVASSTDINCRHRKKCRAGFLEGGEAKQTPLKKFSQINLLLIHGVDQSAIGYRIFSLTTLVQIRIGADHEKIVVGIR